MTWQPAEVEEYSLYLTAKELGVLIERTPNFVLAMMRKYMDDDTSRYSVRVYWRDSGHARNPFLCFHLHDVIRCWKEDLGPNASKCLNAIKIHYDVEIGNKTKKEWIPVYKKKNQSKT